MREHVRLSLRYLKICVGIEKRCNRMRSAMNRGDEDKRH
jgi:hypothetical protein